MNNPYLYVLINGSLKMSAGKVAAQTAHAVCELNSSFGLQEYSNTVTRTVIVLEAKDAEQMKNLETYLDRLEIPNALYVDEGVNEIAPYSVTAMAVGPLQSDDEVRDLLKGFSLYPTKKGWL